VETAILSRWLFSVSIDSEKEKSQDEFASFRTLDRYLVAGSRNRLRLNLRYLPRLLQADDLATRTYTYAKSTAISRAFKRPPVFLKKDERQNRCLSAPYQ